MFAAVNHKTKNDDDDDDNHDDDSNDNDDDSMLTVLHLSQVDMDLQQCLARRALSSVLSTGSTWLWFEVELSIVVPATTTSARSLMDSC